MKIFYYLNIVDLFKDMVGQRISIEHNALEFNAKSKCFMIFDRKMYISNKIDYALKIRDFYEFEDEFILNEDEKLNEDDNKYVYDYLKYTLSIKPIFFYPNNNKRNIKIRHPATIKKVEIYQKRIGLNYKLYEALNKKYHFSPELYLLYPHHNKEDVIIISFKLSAPVIEIYFSLYDFLNNAHYGYGKKRSESFELNRVFEKLYTFE